MVGYWPRIICVAHLIEVARGDSLDRGLRADRHVLGRFDHAVARRQGVHASPGCPDQFYQAGTFPIGSMPFPVESAQIPHWS